MKKTLHFTIIFCAAMFLSVKGYSQLSIAAEIRARAERDDGYKMILLEDKNPAHFIGQRTRLKFNYAHEKFRIGVSIQDVRVWGDENLYNSIGVYGDNSSIDLYEGYGQWLITKTVSLKVGRQELKYDDQRLLSSRNWNNHGLTYDAAVFKIESQEVGFQFDAGFSYASNSENLYEVYYNNIKMKSLAFIYAKQKISDFSISGIILRVGKQAIDSTDVYAKNTFGCNLDYNGNYFNFRTAYYFQNGQNIHEQDVKAYLWSASMGAKLGKIQLNVGMDQLSGQAEGEFEEENSFDIFYGVRYKYYGNMNYYCTPSDYNYAGLSDMYASLRLSLGSKFSLLGEWHKFSLVEERQTLDKDLGMEFDLGLTYKINEMADIKLGYCFYKTTESSEALKRMEGNGEIRNPSWAWIMITFAPELLHQ